MPKRVSNHSSSTSPMQPMRRPPTLSTVNSCRPTTSGSYVSYVPLALAFITFEHSHGKLHAASSSTMRSGPKSKSWLPITAHCTPHALSTSGNCPPRTTVDMIEGLNASPEKKVNEVGVPTLFRAETKRGAPPAFAFFGVSQL